MQDAKVSWPIVEEEVAMDEDEAEGVDEGPEPAEMAPAKMTERAERGVEVGGGRAKSDTPALRREAACDATILLPTSVEGEVDVEHLITGVRKSVDCLLNATARGPWTGSRMTTLRSSAFSAAETRWRRQLSELGASPGGSMDFPFLLRVLESMNTYNLEESTTRRPFVLNHVRVARGGGVSPKRIRDVCAPSARHIVDEPLKFICKSDDELADLSEEDMPVPFTDEALRDESAMRGLIEKLYEAGVLGFRRKARAMVGLFTVAKAGKENQLRLVVDARVANALHRSPPYADLPTGGALGR